MVLRPDSDLGLRSMETSPREEFVKSGSYSPSASAVAKADSMEVESSGTARIFSLVGCWEIMVGLLGKGL